MKKVLIVGMSHSVHTARWINQFKDSDWDIHLFPSEDKGSTHEVLQSATVYHSFYSKDDNQGTKLQLRGIPIFNKQLARLCRKILETYYPNFRTWQLKRLIEKLKPDIVHSMAIQSAGYLTLTVKNEFTGEFPPWLVSNWGSDLYFFGRLSEYRDKVLSVMQSADHYSCESERDEKLAKEFGFSGVTHPRIQAGGAWDLKKLAPLRHKLKPSQRKVVLVKGYRTVMGRVTVALRALERCKELLLREGYEVVVFAAIPREEVLMLAEWFEYNTNIPTTAMVRTDDHQAILDLQAQSRIFIGLSISDGVSNSFLESMIMGSFPIQSHPSNPHEWIENGVTGISVHPEDPEEVERAIRTALTDDLLVDIAAEKNWEVAVQRLEAKSTREKAIQMYATISDN